MANLVTVVIAFVSITTAAIDSHPGTSIGRNYLPAKLDHGPSFAKAFNTRSAATYRRFRARRSPTVGQSWASDFGRFPWMNRFDQDEGSGSEDLEPTPVNQFFDDRLQSADFDTSQQVTTSARSSPVELARSSSPVALAMSTTTMRTVIHVELNSSPTPSHRGRSTLRPVVSESLTEIVTNSKHQRVTTLPLTRLVVTHSPGGDADNSSDIGNTVEVVSKVQSTAFKIPETSDSTVVAWVIIVSIVIGSLLIVTVSIIAIRHAVMERRSRRRWVIKSLQVIYHYR